MTRGHIEAATMFLLAICVVIFGAPIQPLNLIVAALATFTAVFIAIQTTRDD